MTKTIHQALIRHYNTVPGTDPECLHVLLAAPTGKAAYLMGGFTIHTAFKIAPIEFMTYKPLKSDTLNSLRKKIAGVKTIIIDEISMCGCRMFQIIDLRMQEVTQKKAPFGGLNVICIGDLYQLKPVKDSWIFDYPSDDYSIL